MQNTTSYHVFAAMVYILSIVFPFSETKTCGRRQQGLLNYITFTAEVTLKPSHIAVAALVRDPSVP